MTKKDPWDLLIKSSSVVSLVTGFLFLAQIAWGVSLKFKEGVPLWLLLTSSASCFLFGLFLSIWIQNKRSQTVEGANLRKVGQINFDYLPSFPTDHGWRLGFDVKSPDDAKPPEFSAAQDSPVSSSLAINDNGRYYMDYNVDQVQSLANVVEYYVKPAKSGSFYLQANISSQDKTQTRNIWLRHVIGTGAPRQINSSEWSFEIQGEILEDGWILVKLSINEEVASTFGKEGFVYQSLRCLRIRGSLAISPITFYRIES